LAQSLKKINDGLMITSLVEQGVDKQTKLLENIKTTLKDSLQDYKIDIDKNQLKTDILHSLEQATNLAQDLQYNGKQLLTNSGDDSVEIATMTQTYTIRVPETKKILTELSDFISKTDFTNENLDAIILRLNNDISRLNQSKSDFTNTQKQLIEHAKTSIADQAKQTMQKGQVQQRNYNVEVAEFSKANINNVAGHLVASQANIPQAHGMKLLY
jgi:flagellin-like hook-associated protein FlgL